MTLRLIGEFHAVPERPGMRTRGLMATEHGFTSFFVAEFEMDQGTSVPLNTHPIEEGFVVTEGALTIQLGEETMTATAGSVVRIPPGVPHALRNQAIDSARVLSAGAWNRADFFREGTKYLEGVPRKE